MARTLSKETKALVFLIITWFILYNIRLFMWKHEEFRFTAQHVETYICTSVFVSFEAYPIYNMVSE